MDNENKKLEVFDPHSVAYGEDSDQKLFEHIDKIKAEINRLNDVLKQCEDMRPSWY